MLIIPPPPPLTLANIKITMNYSKTTKTKKNSETSKILKSPNNCDIKSVLKPIKYNYARTGSHRKTKYF